MMQGAPFSNQQQEEKVTPRFTKKERKKNSIHPKRTDYTTNKVKSKTERGYPAVDDDPAVLLGVVLGGFFHRVKLRDGRHRFDLFSLSEPVRTTKILPASRYPSTKR